jgi:hypothetical protein
MLDPCPELGLSKKSRDGCAILSKLLSQNFERDNAVLRMISTIDGGGSTLPDHILDAVPGKRGTYERIARHAANLIRQVGCSKRFRLMMHSLLVTSCIRPVS